MDQDNINNSTKSCSVRIERLLRSSARNNIMTRRKESCQNAEKNASKQMHQLVKESDGTNEKNARKKRSPEPSNEDESDEDESDDYESYVPAKRGCRVLSLPFKYPNTSHQETNKVRFEAAKKNTSKCKRQFVEKSKKSTKKTSDDSIDIDVMSEVVSVNCKLTNELLDMKKSLIEKNDALIAIQAKYYEKELECEKLKSLASEKDHQIGNLSEKIEMMRAEKNCSDLIDLNETGRSENQLDAPETLEENFIEWSQDAEQTETDLNIVQSANAKELAPEGSGDSNFNTNEGLAIDTEKFQWTPTA